MTVPSLVVWWSRLIASFKRLAYISFLVGKTLTTGRPTATGNHSVPALAPAPGPTDSTGPTILSTNKSIQSVELNKSRLLVTCLNRYAHM